MKPWGPAQRRNKLLMTIGKGELEGQPIARTKRQGRFEALQSLDLEPTKRTHLTLPHRTRSCVIQRIMRRKASGFQIFEPVGSRVYSALNKGKPLTTLIPSPRVKHYDPSREVCSTRNFCLATPPIPPIKSTLLTRVVENCH